MVNKKAAARKEAKVDSKRSNFLTFIAVLVGAILVLTGLFVVFSQTIEPEEEPVPQSNCRNYINDRHYGKKCLPNSVEDLKPLVYLYPEEETEVAVSFARPELLTTTYPKYNDSWVVVAQPNGDLRDANGKYYYGLYWEGKSEPNEMSEGFYVEASDAAEFLEEKLATIGLNDRERNEFIMYWLPVLEQNGKNFVSFEFTEELQEKNALIISPEPDSLLRVRMNVQKVKEKPNLPEQELSSFERKGFTVVEWGGARY